MPNTELIPTGKIRTDGGTQPRAKINMGACLEYTADMKSGDHFPPVEVYFDGEHYWLADGFHRLVAHRSAHPGEPIEAVVYQGTREDAQWHSYGVNKTHGLRRTNEDKQRAVKAALMHARGAELSDRQIAEHVGVAPSTVAKYRMELTIQVGQSTPSNGAAGEGATIQIGQSDGPPAPRLRTGRDGRTINTARIGRKRRVKVYGAAQAREAIQQGHRVRFEPFITLTLPTNHAPNCAYDLLRFLPFDYLQKVFQEIVRLHQQQQQKENRQ